MRWWRAATPCGFSTTWSRRCTARCASKGRWPEYANPGAEYVAGDVRDREALVRALCGIDVVYHLAAATGVGQSMYQIGKYVEVNVQGTANLLDAVAAVRGAHRPASWSWLRRGRSMARARIAAALRDRPSAGAHARPSSTPAGGSRPARCAAGRSSRRPTPESLAPDPGSIYGVTKLAQEQLCLCTGRAYGLDVTALRFFNVYGPRQSLSNPYTGIFTAFLSRLARARRQRFTRTD